MKPSLVKFPANMTVGDLIAYQARHIGDREYLVFEGAYGAVERLTYAELETTTRRVAVALLSQGLHPGDRMLMMMRNSVECIVVMMACARTGIVTVPINIAYVADEVRHVCELVQPSSFIAHDDFRNLLTDAGLPPMAFGVFVGAKAPAVEHLPYRLVSWSDLVGGEAAQITVPIRSDDLLQLIMTSGTTGQPKAVMHTHANRILSAFRQAMWNRLNRSDRVLNAFPTFHVNCLDGTVFGSLAAGSTAVLLERFSATRFWRQVLSHRATVISVLPTVIRAMMAQPASDTDRDHCVRLIGCGLQAREDELQAFSERFGLANLVAGYGLTEASTSVLQTPLEGDLRYPSMGVPMIDRTVMLVDENDAPVPIGATGEIVVQGDPGRGVMMGYYGDPESTASALRGGWLHTGDMAYCDDQGYFYFVGRSKDMIKRSGENIGSQEVETVVVGHSAVDEVAVIGVPDDFRDEAVMAIVTLRAGAHLDLPTLQSYCRGKLADFKIPTLLEVVDELPKGLLGKVDKKALRSNYQQRRQ